MSQGTSFMSPKQLRLEISPAKEKIQVDGTGFSFLGHWHLESLSVLTVRQASERTSHAAGWPFCLQMRHCWTQRHFYSFAQANVAPCYSL